MSRSTITRQPAARRRFIAAFAVLALSFLGLVAVPNAFAVANAGPYTIDGTGMGGTLVPPANATLGIAPAPTVTTTTQETYGSVKELGPVNGTATKVGVIQKAATPMLALTNPNGQVDLRRAWLSTARASDNQIWQYFAWERDANSGSGFLAFEFNQSLATGTGCAVATSPDAATCNPWNPRTNGDFMIVWDQSGSSTALQIRYWVGNNTSGSWTAPDPIPASAGRAAFNTNDASFAGFKGEAAINLTELFFKNQTGECTSIARVIPNTVTGNSDTADYKDTIFTSIPPISNCGSITINKIVLNAPNNTDLFGFTTTGGLDADPETEAVETSFSLPDGGSKVFPTVASGSYTVTEDTPLLAGYDFVSLACTATGTGTTVDPTTAADDTSAAITMGVLGVVVCTYTNHYTNTTSIATDLSATSINLGGSLHDSATLTGETASAGGTVTYRVFKRAVAATPNCTISEANPNLAVGASWTVTVTNGVVPDSPSFTPTSFGVYDFQAVYSGDPNNEGSTSVCGTERFLVKATPSITTLLSDELVTAGDTVYDTSSLSGATSDAGGTVTYTVFSNTGCTADPRDAGTKDVVNGVVGNSDGLIFNTPGDYYWQAVYSGDANNVGATSVCTDEHLVVAKAPASLTTAQKWQPQDSVTVAATAGGTPTGTVTFTLFTDATCSTTAVWNSGALALTGGATDTSKAATDTPFFTTTTSVYWLVSYSGDATHKAIAGECGEENSSVTIDNGGSVSSAP